AQARDPMRDLVPARPEVGWQDSAARHLVEQALREEIAIPQSAQARVWARIRRAESGSRRRGAGLMFLFGAASPGAVWMGALGWLPLRGHAKPYPVMVGPDGSQHSLRPGAALPQLDAPSVVALAGAGRMVVAPHSVAQFERFDERGITLVIERGSALLHV